jgi:hypothetical protein
MSPSTSKVHGPRGKPGKIYDHAALTIQVTGHQARLTGAEVSFGSKAAVRALPADCPVCLPLQTSCCSAVNRRFGPTAVMRLLADHGDAFVCKGSSAIVTSL